ncbi:MAG: hypothetical protein Q9182_007375 [Xanthomendoza sp. 2 TL-2023]
MERLLKLPATQTWIYDNLFDSQNTRSLSYSPYAFRILKRLITALEAAIEDPEEDEISDSLMNCFAELLTQKRRDEIDCIQEKRPVTYTIPIIEENTPTVTILEAPNLLSSKGDTGNRTWDAALFLATFLSSTGRHFVQDKSVLELGAGLGFLSILCGKHLGAKHVLVTDASEGVMEMAWQNAELNNVEDIIKTAVLEWGTPEVEDVLRGARDSVSFDLILGSDMLYEPRDFPALISTLQALFSRYPKTQFLISSVIRREETIESFLLACKENCFYVERVHIDPLPEQEQRGFFYSTFYEIHIYRVTRRRRFLHEINPLLPNEAEAVIRDAEKWLFKHVPGISNLPDSSLEEYLEVYYDLWTISIPEFINVDDETNKGIWRIPVKPGSDIRAIPAIAMMLIGVDAIASRRKRIWSVHGEGVDRHAGEIFLIGRILPSEREAFLHGEFPATLLLLGDPGPMVPLRPRAEDLARFPGRPSTVQNRHDPSGMHSVHVPRPSHQQARGHQRGNHHLDRGMDRRMDRGMDLMARRPERQRQAVRRQPRGPVNVAGSSSSTDSDSDNGSDESDAPRKFKKGKAMKGNPQGKTKAKTHGRGEMSFDSEEEVGLPSGRKQGGAPKIQHKGKPARRQRLPPDDEITYSADEGRGMGGMPRAPARRAARGRGRSDEEEEPTIGHGRRPAPTAGAQGEAPQQAGRRPEGRRRGRSPSDFEAQAPPGGNAGRPARRPAGGRQPDRSPTEDDAPPYLDPAEQARLNALKAQNNYKDRRA